MSEFSDSYHLRTDDPTQVAQLVRAVRRFGAVLATTGPYIPSWSTAIARQAGLADVQRTLGLRADGVDALLAMPIEAAWPTRTARP